MSTTKSTLCLALILLTLLAYLRPPEYDEAYSLFLTTTQPHPAWPTAQFTPAQVRPLYTPRATFPQIAQNLRTQDVHPPLYFWTLLLWRQTFGPSWFTARLLSVLYAVAALAVLARIARQLETPIIPTLLICLLTYGFAYTSLLARNFALAQLLTLLGVTLTLDSRYINRHCERSEAIQKADTLTIAAGLALGAATFTNDLTIFPALAALSLPVMPAKAGIPAFPAKKLSSWRLWHHHRQSPQDQKFFASFFQKRSAFLSFLLFLPLDATFFLPQHASRTGQFTPFNFPQALHQLARDSAAAWFGGLPLYAGRYAPLVTLLLAALAAAALLAVARRPTPHRAFLIALTLSTPIGLLALGLIFNNTPIEIRYLAFSLPYLALLLATLPLPLQTLILTAESLCVIGLAFAPQTAQPQARAAAEAAALSTQGTLVLLPFGNDGVGIPGPFIAAAPAAMTIQLIQPNHPPALAGATRLILATIAIDAASRAATAQTLAFLQTSSCWQQTSQTPLIRLYVSTCHPH